MAEQAQQLASAGASGASDEHATSASVGKPPLAQVEAPANEYVLVPGGKTHKSCVHVLPDGAVVEEIPNSNDLQVSHPGSITRVQACPYRPIDRTVPVSGVAARPDPQSVDLPAVNDWVAWSSFVPSTNAFGHSAIVKLVGSWKVPSNPIAFGALVYFFNGLLTANSSVLIQPVLQWGNNGLFGGNSWLIASWHVYSNGTYFVSTPKSVAVGDVIVGQMTGSSCSLGGICSWTIATSKGGTVTSISTGSLSAMMNPRPAVLEAYNLTSCSEYPGTKISITDTYAWQIGPSTSSLVEMATAQSWNPNVNSVSPWCGYSVSNFPRGSTIYY